MFFSSKFSSRIVAVLILLAVLAAIGVAVVEPYFDLKRNNRLAIEQNQQLLAAFTERRVDPAVLEARLKALQTKRGSRRDYFTSRNATLAGAELQSLVKSLTEAAGGQISTAQILRTSSDELLQRITVRVQITMDIEQLRQILHGLESGLPSLFVDNVAIQAVKPRRRRRRRDRNKAPAVLSENVLRLTFDVYGYLWGGQPS